MKQLIKQPNKTRIFILIILLVLTVSFCLYSTFYLQQVISDNSRKLSALNFSQHFYNNHEYVEWTNNVNNYCARLKGSANGESISGDEYQIYSVLIDYSKTIKMLESSEWFLEKQVSGICGDEKTYPIADDFYQSENIKIVVDTGTLLEKFNEHRRAAVLSEKNDFYYPGVVVNFSRIAFNEDHSEAYAHVHLMLGIPSALGLPVILKKENNQWLFHHEVEGGPYY